MLAATTSPWYFPTWVSSRTPVTSPTAHRPSPTRNRASTGTPCFSAWTPTVSRPIPSTRGRRPVATSRWSPCISRPSSSARTKSSAVAIEPPSPGCRESVRPHHRAAPRPAPRPRRGLPGQHVLRPFDQDHLAAEPAHGLGHLGPDRSAAQDQQATWHGLHARHLAIGPDSLQGRPGPAPGARPDPSRWPGRCCPRCGAHRPLRPRPLRPAGRCPAAGRCPCPPATVPGRHRSSSRP